MARAQQPKEAPEALFDQALTRWLGHPALLLVLALLCACFAMSGNLPDRIHNGLIYEEQNHIHFLDAAADALGEGSPLLREIPWVGKAAAPVFHRYALFQFYGHLPFFLGGLLVRMGLSSYRAFLLLGTLSYFLSFCGAALACRALGLRPLAGLLAGMLFTLAPYHLTDWYGRFAFTETFALGLLPWGLYSALRCSQRRDLLSFLFAALCWSGIILSHTITHIFAVLLLLGVVCLQWLLFDREDREALLRPLLAYALALLCCAWAFGPILRFGGFFNIASSFKPKDYAFISSLPILLANKFKAASISGNMGLQVGWPLLAALLASLSLLRYRPRLAAYAVLAWASFLLAWSPYDFFGSLGPLSIIQFPYRMLGFLALFGALAGAAVWDLTARRFQPLLLLAAALWIWRAALPYNPLGDGAVTADEVSSFYAKNGTQYAGPQHDYVLGDPNSSAMQAAYPSKDYDLSALPNTVGLAEGVELRTALAAPLSYTPSAKEARALSNTAFCTASATVQFGRVTQVEAKGLRKGEVLLLPLPWYPAMLDFQVGGHSAPYGRVPGSRLAVQAEQDGDLSVAYRFRGLPWANALSYLGWALFAFLGALYLLGKDPKALWRGPEPAPQKAPRRKRA